MRSLKSKLIIFISSLLIIMLAALGLSNFLATSKLINEQTDKEIALRSGLIVDDIENFLQVKMKLLETYAKNSASYYGDNQKELAFIQSAVASTPELKSMVYSPDMIGKTSISHAGAQVDLSERPYIKDLSEGKIAISNPLIDKIDSKLAIVIAAPIMIQDKPAGFLASSIAIDDLLSAVSAEQFGETGYASMFDASGVTVADPDKDNIMTKNIKDYGILEVEDAYQKALGGEKGKLEYGHDGKDYIGYYTTTFYSWVLLVSAPKDELDDGVQTLLTNTVWLSLLFVMIGIAVTYFLSQTLVRPIRKLNTAIQAAATGDLTQSLATKGKDEIAQASISFNQMLASQRRALSDVNQTSFQLAAASEQTSASARQTSDATSYIATSIEQIMSGTEQQVVSVEQSHQLASGILEHVTHIADLSNNVANEATSTYEVSSAGEKAIQGAIGQMGMIAETVHQLSSEFHHVGESSKEIQGIVELITSIAKQTNMLALNAAIEASRAGESGRGFAVVAQEVRKLAEQSSDAAERIATIIQSVQSGINVTEQTIGHATKEVKSGIEVIDSAGALFENIKFSVGNVVEQVSQVSVAAKQVASDTSTMVESISLISGAAEGNAAGTQNVSASAEEQLAAMEEITASSEALSSMAEELQLMLGKFKL
jgi:methyl-accepting chemotaxis protein